MDIKDRIRGSLIGGAAGDALGYAVEFLSENSIFSRYGAQGITEYDLSGGVAQISDDTQMTLFTANGLLYGTTRGMTRGIIGIYESYIWEMYKAWYQTQTERYPLADDEYHLSWLLNIPELFSRRAPGTTCMSAISSKIPGTMESPINTSKGCGSVMRVAPIGLYFCDNNVDDDFVDLLGAKSGALTHGHELAYISAAAMVHIIRAVAGKGLTPKEAVSDALIAINRLFSSAMYIDSFDLLIQKAIDLSESGMDDLEAIHELGEGWVAEEALAIAVYCANKYQNDFDKAIRTAVNHNGDSDSTGAITGNILGAHLGYDAIPQKYKDNLELHNLILEVADDLCNDCQIDEYSSDILWERKYILANYLGR